MIKFFIIIIGIIGSMILTDIELLFQFNFFILCTYLIHTFLNERFIRLYHVWIFAFIYIIIPEGVVNASEISDFGVYGVIASKYLCICNWLVLLSHIFFFQNTPVSLLKRETFLYEKGPLTFLLLMTLLVVYLIVMGPVALRNFLQGRVNIEGGTTQLPIVLSSFIKACGYVLPALIAYYYKYLNRSRYYFLTSFLISLPIFILLFIAGTRFPLLFSLGGFTLMHLIDKKISMGMVLKVIPALIFIGFLASKMKEFRTFGVKETSIVAVLSEFNKSGKENSIYNFGSIEGVIAANAKLVDYFETHDHMMGLSNSFILYFWVPRSVWPDKPQMLGYWFIRNYEDADIYDSGHSVSFSFAGDAYADFGFTGGLLFSLFLGFLLARFDQWVKNKLADPTQYPLVLATLSYSFVFFFVRSPQTAAFNFLGILTVYFLIKKTLSIYIKKSNPDETALCDQHSCPIQE